MKGETGVGFPFGVCSSRKFLGLFYLWHSFTLKMRPNKPNRAELESTIFIVVAWAGEGYKATKFRRYPFQSAHLGALARPE